jgi:hypothetical protein
LHRVEALVRVAQRRPLDPLRTALLGQLSAGTPVNRLGVDFHLLGLWLAAHSADGLIEPAGGGWRLTERGRAALDSGAYAASVEERRTFTFLEKEDRTRPPRFVPLQGQEAVFAPPPDWRFDPATLDACIRRPLEWKKRHGFPTDVEAVAPPSGSGAAPADWRRVILDRAEQITLVFVPSADGWFGYAVRPEGWALQTTAPVLVLPREEAPAEEPSMESWREAWRGWCQGRGLSAGEAEGCRMEPLEDRVRAVAPRRLAERLASERNDAWLLAGTGSVRVAAVLEIVEGE